MLPTPFQWNFPLSTFVCFLRFILRGYANQLSAVWDSKLSV
ncbi:hypothetical protein J699_01329 [Acinetobacter sp. 1000160]|nr:hypothetical protein J522_1074 [Acinetobacter baumannii 146457]EYT21468.1 hypothetical protein J699_01329 [Acinetobacter sp. 1000160]